MTDAIIAERFFDLFAGYQAAHGRCLVVEDVNVQRSQKVKAKSWTSKGAPSPEMWLEHLNGSGPGVGVIPLREDNTVLWAGIDIDDRDIDLHSLSKKCKQNNLPLVVCRSKSGGAHCYLFLREPAPAEAVQVVLSRWSAILGYGGCEIFPKQTSRANEADTGNWLNMPYYNVRRSSRIGVNGDEWIRDPVQFLDLAEATSTTIEEIANIGDDESQSELFSDGPPCLNRILSLGGFEDGTRNNGMYSVIVYLRKRFVDQSRVEEEVQRYNTAMCDPPLPISELMTLVKSVYKKEYGYKCKDMPIKSHCDRRNCLRREFGVGDCSAAVAAWPNIDFLTKHDGDPALWFASVNGSRIGPLETGCILSQNNMRKTIAEKLLLYPPKLPEAKWDKMIAPLIQSAETVPAALDATDGAQFRYLFEQYLTQVGRARTMEDTYRGTPYLDAETGIVWFHLSGLLNYLNNMQFHIKEASRIVIMLKSQYDQLTTLLVSPNDGKSPWNVYGVPMPKTSKPEQLEVNPDVEF